MPAMPIADSSAPIVVGIRQTSSATSTTIGLLGPGVDGERLQRRRGRQEDDGQAGQQDVERDLVGRLLPARALDEGDHPVDEALAGLGRDLDDDAVREHLGAAGDRAPVAAGLADDRRGLAGDRRLVDAGHALDDVAVAGDDLAGDDDDPVAEASAAVAGTSLVAVASSRCAVVSVLARRRVAACALPRPSATASARLANTTVSQSQATTAQAKTLGSVTADDGREDRADLDDEHDRVAHHDPGVELAQGVRAARSAASSGRAARRDALGRRAGEVRG